MKKLRKRGGTTIWRPTETSPNSKTNDIRLFRTPPALSQDAFFCFFQAFWLLLAWRRRRRMPRRGLRGRFLGPFRLPNHDFLDVFFASRATVLRTFLLMFDTPLLHMYVPVRCPQKTRESLATHKNQCFLQVSLLAASPNACHASKNKTNIKAQNLTKHLPMTWTQLVVCRN